MRVVLLESLGIPEDQIRMMARPLEEKGHTFLSFERSDDVAVNVKRVENADVVIVANMPLGRNVIEAAGNLEMISIAFTGYDHVDMSACRAGNVLVSNCAGYSTSSVAELAIGLMIAVSRRICACDVTTRAGGTKTGLMGNELSGKTVGIIGTGAIGIRTARICKAIGCRVIAHSRSRNPEAMELGIEYVTLEKLMVESDVVSLHVPCNSDTKGMVGADMLELMKPSAILINTARGPIVDNATLARVLDEGRIAGAGIDVFDVEPPLPDDYPLLSARNAVLTPHVAFATPEALQKRAAIAFDNVLKWMNGSPQNVVS